MGFRPHQDDTQLYNCNTVQSQIHSLLVRNKALLTNTSNTASVPGQAVLQAVGGAPYQQSFWRQENGHQDQAARWREGNGTDWKVII